MPLLLPTRPTRTAPRAPPRRPVQRGTAGVVTPAVLAVVCEASGSGRPGSSNERTAATPVKPTAHQNDWLKAFASASLFCAPAVAAWRITARTATPNDPPT